MPEASVQQVQHGMLDTADIQVYRHPVAFFVQIPRSLAVVRVDEAQEIPATARPLRHGVGLSQGRLTGGWVCGLDPASHCGKRRLARAGGTETFDFRQQDW